MKRESFCHLPCQRESLLVDQRRLLNYLGYSYCFKSFVLSKIFLCLILYDEISTVQGNWLIGLEPVMSTSANVLDLVSLQIDMGV